MEYLPILANATTRLFVAQRHNAVQKASTFELKTLHLPIAHSETWNPPPSHPHLFEASKGGMKAGRVKDPLKLPHLKSQNCL